MFGGEQVWSRSLFLRSTVFLLRSVIAIFQDNPCWHIFLGFFVNKIPLLICDFPSIFFLYHIFSIFIYLNEYLGTWATIRPFFFLVSLPNIGYPPLIYVPPFQLRQSDLGDAILSCNSSPWKSSLSFCLIEIGCPNACGIALQTGLMQFSREDAVYLTHFDSLCQFLSVSLSGLFRLS